MKQGRLGGEGKMDNWDKYLRIGEMEAGGDINTLFL